MDSLEIAGLAGKYVRDCSAGEPCVVLEIQGEPKSRFTQDIKNAFLQAIQDSPNIVKEYVMTGYFSQVSTQERMNESKFFERQPEIDIIFAHNDSMAIAAGMVAAENDKDPLIIGMGGYSGNNSDLEAIQNGSIDATILCPTGGAEAIDIITGVIRLMILTQSIPIKNRLSIRPNSWTTASRCA